VTPLVLAAHFGHEVLLRALIEADADVNQARDDGATPLKTATRRSFRFSGMRARRDHGNAGVCCSEYRTKYTESPSS